MSSSPSRMSVSINRRGLRHRAAFCATAMVLVLANASLPSMSHAQAREFPDFAGLVEKSGAAVVNIRITERTPEGPGLPLRRRPPGQPQGDEMTSSGGSGFIFSPDGLLLTNAHVVAGATVVHVTLTDKREFKAKVIGSDERSDVALVKIEATGLPFLRIGDVTRLRVGEWVLAIGSPSGPENSVTAGIISGRQREAGSEVPLLKTDMAVGPGSSGGPLLNIKGEVVAINVPMRNPAGSYASSSALPIDEAMRIADQLKSLGRVARGYLGILLAEVPREQAQDRGPGKNKIRGAFVQQVVSGGPAEKTGIRPGDIVLSANGKPVEGALELRRLLGLMKPGAVVSLQINRSGKLIDFKPVLSEMAPQVAAPAEPRPGAAEPKVAGTAQVWGLSVSGLNDSERQALRGGGGVKVVAVSSGAQAVGLRAGDVILVVAGIDVGDVKQFDAVIGRCDRAKPLPLTVLRGDWAQFVRVPVIK